MRRASEEREREVMETEKKTEIDKRKSQFKHIADQLLHKNHTT